MWRADRQILVGVSTLQLLRLCDAIVHERHELGGGSKLTLEPTTPEHCLELGVSANHEHCCTRLAP